MITFRAPRAVRARVWRSRAVLVLLGGVGGVALGVLAVSGGAGVPRAIWSASAWLSQELGWTYFLLAPLAVWTAVLALHVGGAGRRKPERRWVIWQLRIGERLGPHIGILGTAWFLRRALGAAGDDGLEASLVAPALSSTIAGLFVGTTAALLRSIEKRPVRPRYRALLPPPAVPEHEQHHPTREKEIR